MQRVAWTQRCDLWEEAGALFCTCAPKAVGVSFASHDAQLTAAFVIANTVRVTSTHGSLGFDELVFLPVPAPHNGSVVPPATPTLYANSTYGNVALNGLIASGAAASTLQATLASYGGDVKAIFSGGAINGSYAVHRAHGGIGHEGVVIDNVMSEERSGTLGGKDGFVGNASVYAWHSYGHLSLSFATKAPSIFSAITGGAGIAGLVPGSLSALTAHLVREEL